MLRLSLLFVIIPVCRNYEDVFTATSTLEPLIDTHAKIINDLEHYIQKEEKRHIILKRHLNLYRQEHEKAVKDISNYLGNPIDAFTLIKRLTTGLQVIEDKIKSGIKYITSMTLHHRDMKYPTLEDLKGAALALTRLQKIYKLNVHELSQGILNGVKYSNSMTSDDCYELGRVLFYEDDFENALAWMSEAYRKYEEMDLLNRQSLPFTDSDILEYIGDAKAVIQKADKLLENGQKYSRNRVPDHIQFEESTQITKTKKLKRNGKRTTKQKIKSEIAGERTNTQSMVKSNRNRETHSKTDIIALRKKIDQKLKIYEALCRGEMNVSSNIMNKLKCWFANEHHPFLKYAPIKVEQVYIKPDILIFHDVLSDFEIEHIKSLAKPKFKRAVMNDPTTGELVTTKFRISKTASLKDKESPVLARISRRVADLTGLDMKFAEELQVVNYGIGGHYEPHYDFARPGEKIAKEFSRFAGNRIATVLFYMTDVDQGGATVFMKLGLSLFPMKRAAVFWLNLHSSGAGDLATLHAACPVLRGSKWVCTKWLHESGQEFIKPCTLNTIPKDINRLRS